MPIRPENRDRYPADWPAISLEVRERAGQRCEECGVENALVGWRDAAGAFHDLTKETPPLGVRLFRIILTVAHLNHIPEDCGQPGNRPNLRAWCQRCHLRYDAASKRERRIGRERAAAADGDLLAIPFPADS